MVKRYAGISFRCSRRIYCFEVGALHLKVNDDVVVETDRGVNIGRVVVSPETAVLSDEVPAESVKKVLRKAREDDFARLKENNQRELDAAKICHEKIKSYKLKMKLVRAEFMHDGNRVIFYFTAENRVDFRELVKELAHTLHVRVEMRQIGIRDAAGMLGGVGICGRELCCASFLSNFEPVTVKMAKEQNLALNPMKISGICGRLMCCLGYEYENYRKSGSDKGGGRNKRGGRGSGSGSGNRGGQEAKDSGGENGRSRGKDNSPRNPAKDQKNTEAGSQTVNSVVEKREEKKDSGSRKSGSKNSGQRNSGRRNSGRRNSGQRNSGQKNSNDKNSSDKNFGKSEPRSEKSPQGDTNRENRKSEK
ncbi:MAG TPA: hypothetical protein EYP64_02440 [Desulfarculaceae bacterium]|nr:hypothetical protein [Desulfarculaceae bacterium]